MNTSDYHLEFYEFSCHDQTARPAIIMCVAARNIQYITVLPNGALNGHDHKNGHLAHNIDTTRKDFQTHSDWNVRSFDAVKLKDSIKPLIILFSNVKIFTQKIHNAQENI